MKTYDQPLATVSIVTHNSDKIFLSLDSLIEKMGSTNLHIKIFDNGSDEEYKKELSKYLTYPFISIDFYPENKGFGFGHNHNLMTENGTAIIFNPDIIIEENNLSALVDLLKSEKDLAMVAPKILNQDGSTQYLVRNRLDVFDFMLRFIPFKFIKKIFQGRLYRFECRDLPDDHDSYVRMISGSFMVVDLTKFQEVSGFDERYFMYFEDNDLCRKIEAMNYKILYTPRYTVTHLYERGAVKNRKLFRIFMSSMGKYFNKWGWKFF